MESISSLCLLKNNKCREDFFMERIDLEIDDFINYCDYKGLAKRLIGAMSSH